MSGIDLDAARDLLASRERFSKPNNAIEEALFEVATEALIMVVPDLLDEIESLREGKTVQG